MTFKIDILQLLCFVIIIALCTNGTFPWWFFWGACLLSIKGIEFHYPAKQSKDRPSVRRW